MSWLLLALYLFLLVRTLFAFFAIQNINYEFMQHVFIIRMSSGRQDCRIVSNACPSNRPSVILSLIVYVIHFKPYNTAPCVGCDSGRDLFAYSSVRLTWFNCLYKSVLQYWHDLTAVARVSGTFISFRSIDTSIMMLLSSNKLQLLVWRKDWTHIHNSYTQWCCCSTF